MTPETWEGQARAGEAEHAPGGHQNDAKGQLHTVTADGGPTRTNVYDANGNRLCTYEAPATDCDEIALYDAQDRLLEFEGVFYSYTDRGSLFQRDDGTTVETFTYDALGNLTQVAKSGAATIGYIIDARSRRVGKQIDGVLTQQYVWSSPLRIAVEINGVGEVTSRFIYGHGINVPALIVKPDPINGDRIYRVITDHLGSPVYVVNVADPSDVLLDAAYDEWGNVTAYTSGTGAWPIPFGFAGGLYDEDTGLVRFGARDYDPRVGRWTAKDPIRFEGGQANLYVYVGNQPVSLSDPSGLLPWAEVLVPPLMGMDAANWAGGAAWLLSDRSQRSVQWHGADPVLVIENGGWRTFGNQGLTLGHVVILEGTMASRPITYAHELAHVEQHDYLGPAYLPLHILSQAYSWLMSGSYDQNNWLETGPNKSSPCPF